MKPPVDPADSSQTGAACIGPRDGMVDYMNPSASLCFLRTLFDTITETIVFVDRDYRIRMMNQASSDMRLTDGNTTGAAHCYEVLRCSSEPCFHGGSELCPVTEVMQKREPVSTVHVQQDKDGVRRIVEINASPVYGQGGELLGVVSVGRDITDRVRFEQEQKQLEERYHLENKERTIATLAAGLAHDFNNSLTGVMGNAELLLRMFAADSVEARFAEGILELSQRMANLTNQLLAYAKGGKYKQTVRDPAQIVEEALSVVKLRFPDSPIDIHFEPGAEDHPWLVQGDCRQLRQLFENILTNSFEAMEGGAGTLQICLANDRKEAHWECPHQHTHAADDYMRISITDSGKGIPQKDIGKIFEPFFSTKFLGRGLGLAAALGIARNHGGCIAVESRQGGGASVEVLLPRARPELKKGHAGPVPAGATKVLVVDDEPQVIWIVSELLRAEGYDVLTAESGQEALEKIQAELENIGIIILDVLMPGLSGKDIYPRIKEATPHIPVFFSSGYDEQTALAGIRLWKGDGFFRKPYRAEQLISLIREHVTKSN